MPEVLIVILTPLFFMPLMTAFLAYNHGRSFWRWFGIGCGLLTWTIRTYAGYPEGMAFAVLLMNSLTPIIDQLARFVSVI